MVYLNLFFLKKTKKIPGRDLIDGLNIPNFIEKIYVLGDLPDINKKYLDKKFSKELIHVKLPFGSISEIIKEVPYIEKIVFAFLHYLLQNRNKWLNLFQKDKTLIKFSVLEVQ